MKNRILIILSLIAVLSSSCEKFRYHVYSLEIRNSTSREVRVTTAVKLGLGSDGYIQPLSDTAFYTERRMSKDFDGPAAFLSEYYESLTIYFSGVSSYVLLSDIADPLNINPLCNVFVYDDAWDFEIREVRSPANGWPDETYFYTLDIREDKLTFSLE